MVVYVDLAAVINLCIDAILLLLTAALLRQRLTGWRVLTSALLGSLYAVATLFPGTHLLQTFAAKWICSVIMVDWAFEAGALRSFSYRVWLRTLKLVAAFYGVTFAVGGAVYGLHNLFAPASSPFAGLALVDGQVVWWTSIGSLAIVTLLPIAMVLVRLALGHVKQRQRDYARTSDLVIRMSGQEVQLRCLIDTGNELTDPLTRTPVAIVEAASVAGLLPSAFSRAIERGQEPLHALYAGSVLQELENRIAIIPYRGVGGRTGQLLAFRADCAELLQDGRFVMLPTLLFALQLAPLTPTDAYTCILPASVMMSLGEGREQIDTSSHQDVSATIHPSHTA